MLEKIFNFKLKKFLCFELDTGATISGCFGLILGFLFLIGVAVDLAGCLDCSQNQYEFCKFSKDGEIQ